MYFVTTLYIKNKEVENERTIGMYSSEEYASENVERNVHDMFEKGYYNYPCYVTITMGLDDL